MRRDRQGDLQDMSRDQMKQIGDTLGRDMH